MKPYYDDGKGIVIYCGDARELRVWLEADVLVTDPPYGMAYRSGWSGASVLGDNDTGVRDEILRLWGECAPALVFGRWSVEKPRGTRARLVWDKGEWPGMGDLQLPWGPSDEEVYVLGKGFAGTRSGTVLRSTRVGAANAQHPTQKPVQLIEQLLVKCPPGVVADLFCGSGATLEAAKNLGRCAIGIEIEERYCEIAAKRLAQDVLPFDASPAARAPVQALFP